MNSYQVHCGFRSHVTINRRVVPGCGTSGGFACACSFYLQLVVEIGQRCHGLGSVATAVPLRCCLLWWQRGTQYFPCHYMSPVVPCANKSRLRYPCEVRADVVHGRALAVGRKACCLNSEPTTLAVGRLYFRSIIPEDSCLTSTHASGQTRVHGDTIFLCR